jgi:hypothetical protein
VAMERKRGLMDFMMVKLLRAAGATWLFASDTPRHFSFKPVVTFRFLP